MKFLEIQHVKVYIIYICRFLFLVTSFFFYPLLCQKKSFKPPYYDRYSCIWIFSTGISEGLRAAGTIKHILFDSI